MLLQRLPPQSRTITACNRARGRISFVLSAYGIKGPPLGLMEALAVTSSFSTEKGQLFATRMLFSEPSSCPVVYASDIVRGVGIGVCLA